MALPPPVIWMVWSLTVSGSRSLELKVSTMLLFTGTPLTPLPGLTVYDIPPGFAAVPVAKVVVEGVTAFPSTSLKPPTLTV